MSTERLIDLKVSRQRLLHKVLDHIHGVDKLSPRVYEQMLAFIDILDLKILRREYSNLWAADRSRYLSKFKELTIRWSPGTTL